MRARIIAGTAALGAVAALLGAGPAMAASGSFSYVLRGDIAGEIFDPADGECVPFDGDIFKIVNNTDRTLVLAGSCDAALAEDDGAEFVRPGQTHTRTGGSPPAYAVVPLEAGDPRQAAAPDPAAEAEPAPPLLPVPDVRA